MNTPLLHGLPILLVAVVIALIYSRGSNRIAPYRLSQPWTHEPILWSAVEEPVPALSGNGTSGVGGGASGRW